jgi:hypothetical protein
MVAGSRGAKALGGQSTLVPFITMVHFSTELSLIRMMRNYYIILHIVVYTMRLFITRYLQISAGAIKSGNIGNITVGKPSFI